MVDSASGQQSFGEWLRHRRRELDLTQVELARQVGCAPITVRKIEADQMRPSRQLTQLLMEHLGIAADEREKLLHFARRGEAAGAISVTERRDNLPHPISSFIGREREIADVKRLLSISRLVTLTGVGGSGKTRLALEVAHGLVNKIEDGVWWVELAALTVPSLVPQTVARTFGLREAPNQETGELILNYLRNKRLLLAIDNCEHLVKACAELSERLLQGCSNLVILATSREPLAIGGEDVYQVSPLSVPEANEASATHVLQSEAARMFVERAQAVKPDFSLSDKNVVPIVQICRRLDGIPLAIELAAARVRVLTVEHIAQRLDDRFDLLTTGSRTALPRQQTLRATIDWSYELLSDKATTLLCRLSVFAGGFGLRAVEAVCADEHLARNEVLPELSRLVDRSLVEVVQAGEDERYRLLETIRQYARERLTESSEERQVRDKHLEYFMDWVEKVEPKLRDREQLLWWDRIDTEHDNIRAALEWSLSGGDAQWGLRLAGATYWFWGTRAFLQEGFGFLKELLAKIPSKPRQPARAKALLAAGQLAWILGTGDAVKRWYEESLQIWREIGDKWWTAYALDCLGWYYLYSLDPTRAQLQFEEATACARATRERWILAFSLKGLGAAAERSDYAVARPILEESIAIWREIGATEGLADALNQLGTVAHGEDHDERAIALYEESLALFRAIRSTGNVEMVLLNLGCVVQGQGDNDRATRLFREALIIAWESGHKKGIADNLRGLGGAAGGQNKPQRATRLLGAAQSIYDSIGLDLAAWPFGRWDFDRWTASAHTGLDDESFVATYAEGQAMTLEQAVEYALEGTKKTSRES
jgi:predicted ATPase/DNA-binding XRE family transcriptional regulator